MTGIRTRRRIYRNRRVIKLLKLNRPWTPSNAVRWSRALRWIIDNKWDDSSPQNNTTPGQ